MQPERSPDSVTLVVYEWFESQPGTLAWVFACCSAALRAVVAMPNARSWAVLHGARTVESRAFEIERLRGAGLIVVERRSHVARSVRAG